MKKHLKTIAIAALMTAALVGCKKKSEDTATPAPGANEITGNITADATWKASESYSLGGYVYVKSGATLTIEPGTTIKSSKIQSALIVEPGAKIIAKGTASSPIVFTSGTSNPRRGDWAGIVICGKARTNNYVTTAPIIEGGLATTYGSMASLTGTDAATADADNSGILSYVRIEYAGYAPIPGSELNGLSLYALGSGTTLDHVQVTAANDDSFEWFGGCVNAKYLIAYMGIDDDFDTDNGFSGKVQFGLTIRSQYIADQSGSKAYESDHDGSANTNDPQTLCQFVNCTNIGPGNNMGNLATSVAPTKGAATYIAALHTRRNSSISVRNSILIGWPSGILIDSKAGSTGVTCANYLDGTKGNIKNNLVAGIYNNYKANATAGQPGTDLMIYDAISVLNGSGDMTKTDLAAIADSTKLTWAAPATGPRTFIYSTANANRYQYDHAGILNKAFSETNPSAYNFTPATGSPALTGADYTGLSSFFDQVSYIGAFAPGSDWTAGWANFVNTNNQ